MPVRDSQGGPDRSGRFIRQAARRLALIVGASVVVTVLLGGLIGVAAGNGFARSGAIGLYLVGCTSIVFGFLFGVRGPLRPTEREDDLPSPGALIGLGLLRTGVRPASPDERADSLATSWFLLGIGIALVVAGVLLDPRTGLS